MCRNSLFRLRRNNSFRLRASSPQRPHVPKQFVSSAGWQPAAPSNGETIRFVCGLAARSSLMCRNSLFRLRRNNSFRLRASSPQRPHVPKQFVSSAGWQPAVPSNGETIRFVCGLAARSSLMCRNSLFRLRRNNSFRLRACSPQRPHVPKQFVSSAGCQPAAPSNGETIRFVCGLAARSSLMCRNSLFRLRRNNSFRLRASSPQRPHVPKQLVSSAGSPQRPQMAKQFVSSAGWQPAAASCAETVCFVCGVTIPFVCGLAARSGLMCRNSSFRRLAARSALKWRNNSFRLRAGSPQQPHVPKQFVSSAA